MRKRETAAAHQSSSEMQKKRTRNNHTKWTMKCQKDHGFFFYGSFDRRFVRHIYYQKDNKFISCLHF